jgi:hypothetical protein
LKPYFGAHPAFKKVIEKHREEFKQGRKKWPHGDEINFMHFFDPRHPEVFLIPRDRCIALAEDVEELAFAPYRQDFPFSSYDFYTVWSKDGFFHDLAYHDAFWRLGGISQLGYLVPPIDPMEKGNIVFYLPPAFSHTRFLHSVLTAQLAEVILARNGFSQIERMPVVIAAGSHDIAMPAGGDSVIRVDREKLSEEENYSRVLKKNGLDLFWQERYGFNLAAASGWIKGEGIFGCFLDIIDKMAYTAIDCYFVGSMKRGKIRSFGAKHKLVMDVWQDVRFTADRIQIYFVDPERLFLFLKLRLLEHEELLYNPRSRALDFFLTAYVGRLWREGKVTQEELITRNDEWLGQLLERYFPEIFHYACVTPDKLRWRGFRNERDLNRFRSQLKPEQLDHLEFVKKIKTGLDWLVLKDGRLVALRDALSLEKVNELESIVNKLQRWVVYYYEPREN